MHYLVTGHTGFKGAWLSLMLAERGHTVSGLSLDPAPGSLFETARVVDGLKYDQRVDIRDAEATRDAVRQIRPDIVFHLAAQPLVRESYREPRVTFETNVMGTLNVLEAVGALDNVRANVVVTTDKVYRNINQVEGYVESDPLGGEDPYSASKAMADILTQSWVLSFPGAPTAIARAGNVIGGGDVSRDRLLPDLLDSFAAGRPAHLRYPSAVRPWQHVLDCLAGYIALSDALLDGDRSVVGQWNFGPGPAGFVTVGEVAGAVAQLWGEGAAWETDEGEHPHEAGLLALDATKAETQLGWHNRLSIERSLAWTVDWRKAVDGGGDPRDVTLGQIGMFSELP